MCFVKGQIINTLGCASHVELLLHILIIYLFVCLFILPFENGKTTHSSCAVLKLGGD